MISIFLCFILGLVSYLFYRKFQQPSQLPPGPWGLPVVGHLPLMGDFPPKALLKWKQKYGPIYTVDFGSFRTVMLNDAKMIKEAFSNPELCDRPDLSAYKGATEGRGLLFADYHDVKEQRQFISKSLRQFGLHGSSIEDKINEEISDLLATLEKEVGKPFRIQYAFSASVINSVWSCLMSDRFPENDTTLNQLVFLIRRLAEPPGPLALLGLFVTRLGELMPDLTHVNSGKRAYHELYAFMEQKIKGREKTRIPNLPRDVTDAYLDKVKDTTDTSSSFAAQRNFQPAISGDLFFASTDTVGNTLEWTMLLLGHYEGVQRKLQEEIDERVTASRIPTLSDRPEMPYTEAVIHEILRFTSTVPIGVFHAASADVNFHGFVIPKGTAVGANTYGVHHDPEYWPDPDSFKPERFLDENGAFQKNPNFVAFGAGRRVCLGETFAKDELFLFITRIFQRFILGFPGKPPSLECKFGFTLQPESFEVVFSKRY